MKAKLTELRRAILKHVIKYCVRKYDKLCQDDFMTLSWGADNVTDYHVIAERSYPNKHIWGTYVDELTT